MGLNVNVFAVYTGKPLLEVAPVTVATVSLPWIFFSCVLLIYSFQFRSAFQPRCRYWFFQRRFRFSINRQHP